MATSVNEVTLLGNLARDPEIRNSRDGKKIANLALATNESWTDRQTGERRSRVEYHNVVVFSDQLSDMIGQSCHKGSRLMIKGTLRTRKWQDQNGNDRYSVEINVEFSGTVIFLDPRGDGNRSQDQRQSNGHGQNGGHDDGYDDRSYQGGGQQRGGQQGGQQGGGQQRNNNYSDNRNQNGGGQQQARSGGDGGWQRGNTTNPQQPRGNSFNQQLDDEIPF